MGNAAVDRYIYDEWLSMARIIEVREEELFVCTLYIIYIYPLYTLYIPLYPFIYPLSLFIYPLYNPYSRTYTYIHPLYMYIHHIYALNIPHTHPNAPNIRALKQPIKQPIKQVPEHGLATEADDVPPSLPPTPTPAIPVR